MKPLLIRAMKASFWMEQPRGNADQIKNGLDHILLVKVFWISFTKSFCDFFSFCEKSFCDFFSKSFCEWNIWGEVAKIHWWWTTHRKDNCIQIGQYKVLCTATLNVENKSWYMNKIKALQQTILLSLKRIRNNKLFPETTGVAWAIWLRMQYLVCVSMTSSCSTAVRLLFKNSQAIVIQTRCFIS